MEEKGGRGGKRRKGEEKRQLRLHLLKICLTISVPEIPFVGKEEERGGKRGGRKGKGGEGERRGKVRLHFGKRK